MAQGAIWRAGLRIRSLRRVSLNRASVPKEHPVRPDGEIRWLLPCGQHSTLESGETVEMMGGVLDVTDQHRTTEQLRIAQKNDLIGNLMSGVAHNFNNMLAIIQPALDLALRQPHLAHIQSLEDALHATKRAAELVSQLMTFAGRRGAPVSGSVDLVTLLASTVSRCQRTLAYGVRLEITTTLGAAHVSGDAVSIEQVVVSLLLNARDAVAEAERSDARISVALCEEQVNAPDSGRTERYFCIRVKDNGVGMSDAVKARLFEPMRPPRASRSGRSNRRGAAGYGAAP